jgi:hypothetical protein
VLRFSIVLLILLVQGMGSSLYGGGYNSYGGGM